MIPHRIVIRRVTCKELSPVCGHPVFNKRPVPCLAIYLLRDIIQLVTQNSIDHPPPIKLRLCVFLMLGGVVG